jgi:hypothetical protein
MCFVFSLNCGPFSKEHEVHPEKQIKYNSHLDLFCKVSIFGAVSKVLLLSIHGSAYGRRGLQTSVGSSYG